MQKTCQNCGSAFQIDQTDLEFYENVSPVFNDKKINIPPPELCPNCRSQRRLAIRNEVNLHHRKCAKTGRQIVSIYPAESDYVVYDQDIWWGDDWDPLQPGREFDFSRNFFAQFSELQKTVPRLSLNGLYNENSYYTNYSLHNKNCYLITTADYNELSFYGRFCDRNFNCCDFDFTYDSKQCYEVIDVHNCTCCFFSQKCNDSSELWFCYDMRNCHNCLFCGNLRNKQYHVFNKPVSESDFKQMTESLRSAPNIEQAKKKAAEYLLTIPRKNLENVQCEDCLGDYLQTSQRAFYCFDGYGQQDTKYCNHCYDNKDCQDWDFVGGQGSELCYQMASCAYDMKHCAFVMNSWEGNSNLLYCDLCVGCHDCLGCISLRKKRHCIFNKQYSKEEYEKLAVQIINHMQKTGEWGQFFPIPISTIGYNDSVAQEYFPLTADQAKEKGYPWQSDEEKKGQYLGPPLSIQDTIRETGDEIITRILICETTGKPYKITPQELALYRELQLPVPRKCPKERYRLRREKRNPRKLFRRECQKCGADIWTTYNPSRLEIVYCEKCYLDAVN